MQHVRNPYKFFISILFLEILHGISSCCRLYGPIKWCLISHESFAFFRFIKPDTAFSLTLFRKLTVVLLILNWLILSANAFFSFFNLSVITSVQLFSHFFHSTYPEQISFHVAEHFRSIVLCRSLESRTTTLFFVPLLAFRISQSNQLAVDSGVWKFSTRGKTSLKIIHRRSAR